MDQEFSHQKRANGSNIPKSPFEIMAKRYGPGFRKQINGRNYQQKSTNTDNLSDASFNNNGRYKHDTKHIDIEAIRTNIFNSLINVGIPKSEILNLRVGRIDSSKLRVVIRGTSFRLSETACANYRKLCTLVAGSNEVGYSDEPLLFPPGWLPKQKEHIKQDILGTTNSADSASGLDLPAIPGTCNDSTQNYNAAHDGTFDKQPSLPHSTPDSLLPGSVNATTEKIDPSRQD